MYTLTLSAGAIFALGLCTGIMIGVIGVITVAYIIVRNRNKGE